MVPQTAISEETKKEVAPVMNGESDLDTQTPNQTVEDKTIPEETETNSALNGTTEEKENVTESIAPEVSVVENKDEVKFNGNGTADIETSNLEVKSENENLNAHSQISSDLSIQSPPPPLPISPQPSQVMSFALNDDNNDQQQQNVENKSPPNDLNVTPQLEIPSVIETAPTPEIERKEEISPDIVKDIPVTISEEVSVEGDQILATTSKVDSEQEQSSEVDIDPVDLTSESNLIEVKEIAEDKNLIEENPTVNEQIEDVEKTNCEENDKEEENKEQIAECLVDEITQTAVGIVEKQLNNEDLPQVPSESETLISTLNGLNGHGNIDDSNDINSPSSPVDEHLAHKVNN